MQSLAKYMRVGLVVVGTVFVGAALGISAAPSVAGATEEGDYKCLDKDLCGAGTSDCCKQGNGVEQYCTTLCPIVVS